jgi:endonuclease/exonuclease/phosphatase family metal-dependent hydrolase
MKTYSIAWWNVENLFDAENSPARSDKLNRTLKNELSGWTDAILGRKIANLASVITQLNSGAGPDVLGVCEVENRPVLQRLVDALVPLGRNYLISHDDMSDTRGIDVAFIYDADKMLAEDTFSHTIQKRTATRELFQVNFRTTAGRLLAVIGNHWPARTAGVYDSEAYRIVAGETLAYFNDRIEEIHGDDIPILAMGDFNDEPSDRSMQDHALSERNRTRVLYANTPKLLNLMWPRMSQGAGTHYYNNDPSILDQFLVSGGFLKSKSKIKAIENSVQIVQLPEMIKNGRYPVPIRFGRPSRGLNQNGFSDHYPITMSITESLSLCPVCWDS